MFLVPDENIREIHEQLLDGSEGNYLLDTVWITSSAINLVYRHIKTGERETLCVYELGELTLEIEVNRGKNVIPERYRIDCVPRKVLNRKKQEVTKYYPRIVEYRHGELKRTITDEETLLGLE